jgi:hypothetical protein
LYLAFSFCTNPAWFELPRISALSHEQKTQHLGTITTVTTVTMLLWTNMIAMPSTQRDLVQINILCFEASSSNLATVSTLKAAATDNGVVTAEAL